MSSLMRWLHTITSSHFPTGMLVVLGFVLLFKDSAHGLITLGFAVGWHYFQGFFLTYGARDGKESITALEMMVLAIAWAGAMALFYYGYPSVQ